MQNENRSTGPITDAGKLRVRQNATQHGLSAGACRAIEGEDPTELTAFFQSMRDALRPVGVAEAAEVEQIAMGYWRLRRVGVFEKSILDHSFMLNMEVATAIPTPHADTPTPPEPPTAEEVAGFSNLARDKYSDKQHRHEVHAVRMLGSAINRLHQLRALRNGDPMPIFITQSPLPRRQRRQRLQIKPANRLAGLTN